MGKPDGNTDPTRRSSQNIDNLGFDEDYLVPATGLLGFDGVTAKRQPGKIVASKITVSGSDTYVGIAACGTAQATAAWQAKKITVSGSDTTITWADGNANFDNVATDLTAPTYS